MAEHRIVSRAEWLDAMSGFVAQEKEWTRARDRLAELRRGLPWLAVRDYVFAGPQGPVTLSQLFGDRSQLIVYHFMFGPDWTEGCPGCSLLCDQVDSARRHLEQKDVSWVAVSRAPLAALDAYRERMGWTFRWVSSLGSDFNFDFDVSFPAEARSGGIFYNFRDQADPGVDELQGVSVFSRGDDGALYRTYSTYGRGGEIFTTVYAWLDLLPKGREEAEHGGLGDWVRRHDEYPDAGRLVTAAGTGASPDTCCPRLAPARPA